MTSKHYYKNYELANLFGVSQAAVGKWVESAKKGKLDLALIEVDAKSYIANTTRNAAAIEAMVHERRKYLNSRSHKEVTPKPEFYKLFTPEQIFDIILHIEFHGEIPRQYNYFGEGTGNWDKYMTRLYEEGTTNFITSAIEQLHDHRSYIDSIIANYEKVNIVDIGPGNALTLKAFMERLKSRGVLGNYLAVDIAPGMLDIAKNNIHKWFNGEVLFDGAVRDMNHQRFADFLATRSVIDNNERTFNMAFVLGGTLDNLRSENDALRTIQNSLGKNDVLIYNMKMDTEANRRFFDFNPGTNASVLSANHKHMLELLNITDDMYDAEMGYDDAKRQRYIRIRLKVELTIYFELPEGQRNVSLKKDETLLLWRFKHHTVQETVDRFTANGFNVLQTSQTPDHEYLLLICDIATDR